VIEPPPAAAGGQDDDDRLLRDEEELVGGGLSGGGSSSSSSGSSSAAAPAARAPEVDLLGEDLLGLGFGGGGSSSAAAAPAPAPALVPGATLDAPSFQAKWQAFPVAASVQLRATRLPGSPGEVEGLCKGVDILTIASGDTGAALKWFQYAQDTGGRLLLLEALMDKSNGAMTLTVRCEAGGAQAALVAAYRRALAGMLVQ
jgi:hypothetical protein